MGASGWSYVTPYSEDPTVWLGRLHREVLASGDYYWGDEEVPRPSTMEQLSALFEQDEDLACEGTHTILDIWQVAPPGVRPAGDDIFGTLISLNEDEVRLMFGTDRPDEELFRSVDPANCGPDAVPAVRGSGYYTPLFRAGVPVAYAVWGVSGD